MAPPSSRTAGALFYVDRVSAPHSFQWWNEIDLTGSSRRMDFVVPVVSRVDSTLPNPQLVAAGVMADVRVAPHLAVTAGYLFADLPQRAQSHVHIPLVALTAAFRAGRARIADRNRLEQLVGFGTSPVRYRNRLVVDLPLGARASWHVFGEDEVFVDMSASTWSQNRFQVGGGARVFRAVTLDVFYLLRDVRGSSQSTQVFGTTLRLMLTPPPERQR